jgi:ubiquitin C-terminal hydrolase
MADKYKIEYEPIPTNERLRDGDVPSGLKNVGNTCYFASLMQALFHLPNIQEKILNYDVKTQTKILRQI